MFNYKGIDLQRIAHDCFLVSNGKINLYFDPFKIESEELPKADYIFITHEHFDHFSIDDIRKIIKESAVLFINEMTEKELGSQLSNKVVIIKPGDSIDYNGIHIKGVPAYNVNKFREHGIVYHPKEDKKLGFIVTIDGVKIYHTGDSDNIPEMENLKEENIDILLIPVSGTYVMTSKEASDAAVIINAKVAIPMHYGAIVGSDADAQDFVETVKEKGLNAVLI
ncbi:MAG: MBL fold metallo-hydrolase [bacterium]